MNAHERFVAAFDTWIASKGTYGERSQWNRMIRHREALPVTPCPIDGLTEPHVGMDPPHQYPAPKEAAPTLNLRLRLLALIERLPTKDDHDVIHAAVTALAAPQADQQGASVGCDECERLWDSLALANDQLAALANDLVRARAEALYAADWRPDKPGPQQRPPFGALPHERQDAYIRKADTALASKDQQGASLEGDAMRKAVKLAVIEAEYHLKKYRPHVYDALIAALASGASPRRPPRMNKK